MTTNEKVVHRKLSLLELAKELNNANTKPASSRQVRIMGPMVG